MGMIITGSMAMEDVRRQSTPWVHLGSLGYFGEIIALVMAIVIAIVRRYGEVERLKGLDVGC